MRSKRSSISLIIFVLAMSVVKEAFGLSITFVSDTTWAVSNPAGTSLGVAQDVCLNTSSPSNCPAGATLYGFPGAAWTADLSAIPGATWIWAPGITGATSPAIPAEFFFSKTFNLAEPVIAGTIAVAVDDFAEIFVNGTSVGTTGSVTNASLASAAQASLTDFDVTSLLVTGTNVITVRAANGAFGCGAASYSCNPAGVVFGGTLVTSPVPEPGTMLLLGSSLIALVRTSYRHRKRMAKRLHSLQIAQAL